MLSSARHVPRYRLGPVVIDTIRRDAMIESLIGSAERREGLRAGYVNAHVFEELHRNRELARAMADLDLVFCDGVGARFGLRFLGIPVPERMATPDFIDEIFAGLDRLGRSVFLLGDEPEVATRMADVVSQRWKGLVAGYHHGYLSADEEPVVVEAIRESGAAMVLVAMGCPRQEIWMSDHRALLPDVTALAVGGMFRWYTGYEWRGPRWLTDRGFEWLLRLLVQPRKVAKRYLLGLPRFGVRTLGYRVGGVRAVLDETRS